MSASGDSGDGGYCIALEGALRQAISIFGDQAAEALILALKERYNIRLGQAPCSSVEEIFEALADLSGPGADILVSRIRSFLR